MSDATRKAKAGHKKNRVTVDQIVAAEFEPWVHGGPDEWTPPSNTQWAEQAPYLLPYVRMAWMSMYKSKGELETIARELDEEPFRTMVDGIVNARKFFENFVTILSSAELRIMSAASALAADDPEEFAKAKA